MIDQALFDHLTDDATVAGIIGTRAYPQKAPASATYPLLTYFMVDDGSLGARGVAGAAEHFRTLYQIDVHARTRLEAQTLANAVRNALDNQSGTWGGTVVKASIYLNQLDGNFESNANLHRIIMQFRISF